MALFSLTITLTEHRLIDGWVAAANRNGTTPEELALEFLRRQGRAYADLLSIGLIPTGAFITRFTPSEYTGILTAAEGSPDLAELVEQLVAEPRVAFDDPRLEPGLQKFVAAGLMAPERVQQLLAYERPKALQPQSPITPVS